MSDGGYFPWRRQRVDRHRGPPALYRPFRLPTEPLPEQINDANDIPEDLPVATAKAVVQPEATGVALTCTLHTIQPTDTLQGICLRYGVTATQLRQANQGFSQWNLAPSPLKIPVVSKRPPAGGSEDSEASIESATIPVAACKVLVVDASADQENHTDSLVPVAVEPVGDDSQEHLARAMMRALKDLSQSEAKAYLELADGHMEEALGMALEDGFQKK